MPGKKSIIWGSMIGKMNPTKAVLANVSTNGSIVKFDQTSIFQAPATMDDTNTVLDHFSANTL